MIKWIKCFRLPICFLAALLTIASFRIVGSSQNEYSWISLCIFLIACSTMLQNDWRDRNHDLAKGKSLVVKNSRKFRHILIFFWMLVLCCIWITVLQGVWLAAGLAAIALGGLIYSELRKIPFLPTILTALVSASPALLPFLIGAYSDTLIWIFFSVSLIIFGREITKDIDDINIDKGYKWTVPIAIGTKTARLISCFVIMLGLGIFARAVSIAFFGSLIAFWSVIWLLFSTNTRIARALLDTGLGVVVLSLISTL